MKLKIILICIAVSFFLTPLSGVADQDKINFSSEIIYAKTVDGNIIVYEKNNTFTILMDDKILFRTNLNFNAIGFDYANVSGNDKKEIMLIGPDNIYCIDANSGKTGISLYGKNNSILNLFYYNNDPKEFRYFHALDKNTYDKPVYFGKGGIFTEENGIKILVASVQWSVYRNNFSGYMFGGRDNIFITYPRFSVQDISGGNSNDIVLFNEKKLSLYRKSHNNNYEKFSELDLSSFIQEYLLFYPFNVSYFFEDINSDGLKDLIMLDAGIKSGSIFSVQPRILCFQALANGTFNSIPSKTINLKDIIMSATFYDFIDINADGKKDLCMTSMAFMDNYLSIMFSRSLQIYYSVYYFTPAELFSKNNYKKITKKISIDSKAPPEPAKEEQIDFSLIIARSDMEMAKTFFLEIRNRNNMIDVAYVSDDVLKIFHGPAFDDSQDIRLPFRVKDPRNVLFNVNDNGQIILYYREGKKLFRTEIGIDS